MSLHLRGMWVAFGVAASFIVYFLLRVRRALARARARAGGLARLAARQERLASLATLAAGAAHELLTPLSTIAVVAKRPASATSRSRRRRSARRRGRTAGAHARSSAAARIIERMRADAGDTAGEGFAPVSGRRRWSTALAGRACADTRVAVRAEIARGGRRSSADGAAARGRPGAVRR